jgi:SAM-dependent methyltransferase
MKQFPADQRSAPYYDALYRFKDYASEARRLMSILGSRARICSMLDVACGTHEHGKALATEFEVDGLDINASFLEMAREKNPRGRYTVGDMRDFALGKRYDAVVCLHSSIGYLKGVEELDRAVFSMVSHLSDHGVLAIEPWFLPETFEPGKASVTLGDCGATKVVRSSYRSRLGPRESRVQFVFTVCGPSGIDCFEELHDLQLFTRDEIFGAMRSHGLAVEHDATWSKGRGLFIGSRTPSRFA